MGIDIDTYIDVIHCPSEWVRDHGPGAVRTVDGPFVPGVAFGHGPTGVCLQRIGGEAWWLVYWRDSGRLLACWEDVHLAQTFADTFMRVPCVDEILAGMENPVGTFDAVVGALKSAVAAMSQSGVAALDPSTNRPAELAEARLCM